MKKNNDIQEWLRLYDTSVIPENKMNELISAGKKYMDSAEFNKNSLQNVLLSQLQYLPFSFWIIQIGLVIVAILAVCLFGYWNVPLHYPLTALVIIIPLIVLVGVREVSKSNIYDMWEIEQSSRCQLVKITACRMLIIGLADLFLITSVLVITSFYYQQSILEIILYGMVPFNISCTCYLFTIIKNEKGQITYHLFVCMICIAVIFSIILKQEILFETSMLWGWVAFYFFSLILLGKTIWNYMKHEKMIGELAWNLQ